MLVHHSGHDSKSRGRGSSAMTAAMDIEYKVSKSNNKVTLKCTKMKDNETPRDINFDLNSVTLGNDEESDVITAPYLEKHSALPAADKSACLNATNQLTLDVLTKLISETGVPVSKAEWKAACMDVYSVSSSPEKAREAKDKKFNRCLKVLLELGVVVEDNGCFTVAGSDTDSEVTTEGG